MPTNVPAAPTPSARTTATATSATPPVRCRRAPSRSTSSTPKPAAAKTTACQGSRESSSAAGTANTASSGTPAAAGAPASTAAPYTATRTAPNATVTRKRISGVGCTGAMPVAICVPAPADSAAKRANAAGPGTGESAKSAVSSTSRPTHWPGTTANGPRRCSASPSATTTTAASAA